MFILLNSNRTTTIHVTHYVAYTQGPLVSLDYISIEMKFPTSAFCPDATISFPIIRYIYPNFT
jgi:hypothetical protein